jgi:hypothetical protein
MAEDMLRLYHDLSYKRLCSSSKPCCDQTCLSRVAWLWHGDHVKVGLPGSVYDPEQHKCGGAGEGNRTLMTSLEGWGSAIELRPRHLAGTRELGAPTRRHA